MTHHRTDLPHEMSRRTFVCGAAAPLLASALGLGAEPASTATEPKIGRQIKLGIVGMGMRGNWLGGLFQKHGGYQIHAVADYFPEVADRAGDTFQVDKKRRFSGLLGYQKLLASGVEAVVLETPPCFFPEHARAAVDAGCHVFMAKPVAVDVPGCLAIEAAARVATKKKLVFFIDYQFPTAPLNIEVVRRIRQGAMGKIAWLATMGSAVAYPDPPKTKTIESRLQDLIWVNDIALGGDYVGNYDIHAIDAALWVAGSRPVSASGEARIMRSNPHGDSHDACSLVFQFADGLFLNHSGQSLKNNSPGTLVCQIFGTEGIAQINYAGKVFLRGGKDPFAGGTVMNLFVKGAQHNVVSFYGAVAEGRPHDSSVQRAVDGALTTILGREAAIRHVRLTMDQLLKENKRLEVDLTGLKA
jgi:predicted dehydrogenase